MSYFSESGIWFAWVYGILLAAWWYWIYHNWDRMMEKFEVESSEDSGEIPSYQTAFLAGGLPRVAQLAVVELIDLSAISFNKKLLGKSRLSFLARPDVHLEPPALTLLNKVESSGNSGLAMDRVVDNVRPAAKAVNIELAKRGLRPTETEMWKLWARLVTPLVLLILIGCVRSAFAYFNDRPFGILSTLLLISLISLFALKNILPRLTSPGKAMLNELRETTARPNATDQQPGSTELLLAVAVLGPTALANVPAFSEIQSSLASQLKTFNGGGGDGGDSGCGGGGCGGGGCGGGCGG